MPEKEVCISYGAGEHIPYSAVKFDEKALKEPEKEWELGEYEQYLLDLYEFLAPYYMWSLESFYDSPIDDVYYLRDKYLEKLSADPGDPKAMPLGPPHWALLKTLSLVFGGKKKK